MVGYYSHIGWQGGEYRSHTVVHIVSIGPIVKMICTIFISVCIGHCIFALVPFALCRINHWTCWYKCIAASIGYSLQCRRNDSGIAGHCRAGIGGHREVVRNNSLCVFPFVCCIIYNIIIQIDTISASIIIPILRITITFAEYNLPIAYNDVRFVDISFCDVVT